MLVHRRGFLATVLGSGLRLALAGRGGSARGAGSGFPVFADIAAQSGIKFRCEPSKTSQMATNAAAVIFAHSILDDAVSQYIGIAASLSPRDWETALAERRLSLLDYKGLGTYEVALQSMLEKYLMELNGKGQTPRR